MAENKILTTPEAIVSYPHLLKAKKNDKGEDVFSCALIFTPEQQQHPLFKALVEHAVSVGKEKFGADFEKLRKSDSFKWAFRRDWDAKGYPEGSVYFNVRSKTPPGVVGPDLDPKTGKPRRITDAAEIYPGAKVRATLTCYAFDNVSKGVSFGLRNIQKVGEGDRLDSRKAAEDEFEALVAAAEPADINALY